ncbi:MAG: amidohydrolase family protein [Betaproteobacteria bacterium]
MKTFGAIDIVVNVRTPQEMSTGLNPTDANFASKIGQSSSIAKAQGVSIDDYIKKMDKCGIERSLLIAVRCGDLRMSTSMHLSYERVSEICKAYPDRFSGVAGIDPTQGLGQLRQLQFAINELGFVAAHYYPHWFDMPPDHPYVMPINAKCAELGIPIMMHVGHNLVYRSDYRLPSVAKPISFDRIAILYPELTIIGIHLGVPWVDEMISMAWKHDNVYFAGDAYAPKHWPSQVVQFANTYGQDKFLFATDWPVIEPERAIKEINDQSYRPESYKKIMRNNALKIFNITGTGLNTCPKDWATLLPGDSLKKLLNS